MKAGLSLFLLPLFSIHHSLPPVIAVPVEPFASSTTALRHELIVPAPGHTRNTSTGNGFVHSEPSSSTRWTDASSAKDRQNVHVPTRRGHSGSGIGPIWQVYGRSGTIPFPDELSGFNVVALAFWSPSGGDGWVAQWTSLTDSERTAIKTAYSQKGVKLVVSAFGAANTPTTSGWGATATADELAKFVQQYQLDGVDCDYEDFQAFTAGTAEAWLAEFTTSLRKSLPQGQYILSHAPIASWFQNDPAKYPGGGYLAVDKQVGSSIDYYFTQYYNGGVGEWETCDQLIKSNPDLPGTALAELAQAGVDVNKIVIGKPATQSDLNPPAPGSGGGYTDPQTLSSCLQQAHSSLGWAAGAGFWQYASMNGTAEVTTVRGNQWSVKDHEGDASEALSGMSNGGAFPASSPPSAHLSYIALPVLSGLVYHFFLFSA